MFVATWGLLSFARMLAGIQWNAGGSNPQPGNRHGIFLPPLSRFFCDVLLRMQVELQTINLGVAGSSPVGLRQEAVAQW